MKNVARLGDNTNHGGSIITASSSCIVEGKPVALVGDLVSCPVQYHGISPIITGSTTCFSDGKPIAIHDSVCGCGCKLISSIKTAEME